MIKQKINLFEPSPEHELLRETLKSFVQNEVEPQALQSDRLEMFNLPLFKKLASLGILGITVPEKYGGAGMDTTAAVIAHEEISFSDPGFCLTYLAHSMLCANNIAVNADHEQKQKYLPALCSGKSIGAMAMSEAGAGTDVLALSTSYKKEADQYIINGRKMWITNGAIDNNKTPCDTLILYTKAIQTKANKPQLTTFIIEKNSSGFYVGQKISDKLGMRASNTAELCFDNCTVSEKNRLGEEGEALKHMMRNLEIERLCLAAMGLGISRRCLKTMLDYSKERKAFGKNIYAFGQIQAYVAESYAEYQAARTYVYYVANNLDLNSTGNRLMSDGAKLFTAPLAKRIADRAIQVLGGNGYIGEYAVERLWRDAKLLEIGGGTIESHHKNITNDLVENLNL